MNFGNAYQIMYDLSLLCEMVLYIFRTTSFTCKVNACGFLFVFALILIHINVCVNFSQLSLLKRSKLVGSEVKFDLGYFDLLVFSIQFLYIKSVHWYDYFISFIIRISVIIFLRMTLDFPCFQMQLCISYAIAPCVELIPVTL